MALALAGLITPEAGTVEVDGFPADYRVSRRAVASRIGLLFQNPETQLLTSRVMDEIALGLRNLGWPLAHIEERVRSLLAALDLEPLADRSPRTLSGGEMQRVALAAALAPEPRYLVLDEPTAHLDPQSTWEVERAIAEATGGGKALRLDLSTLPSAPHGASANSQPSARSGSGVNDSVRLIVLDQGSVVHDGPGPLPPLLAGRLLGTDEAEVAGPLGPLAPRRPSTLRARGLEGGWNGSPVFGPLDLELSPGTVTHIGGRSGAGKSTLLLTLAGLVVPLAGHLELDPSAPLGERVTLVFQLAERLFYRPTVEEELEEFTGFAANTTRRGIIETMILALARLGLDSTTLSRPPLQLSGGEVRRLALATSLLSRRPILLLDEPGAGLDGPGRRLLHRLVRSFSAEGGAVLVVSHDPELAALADVRWVLTAGRLEPAGSDGMWLASSSRGLRR